MTTAYPDHLPCLATAALVLAVVLVWIALREDE